MSSKLETQPSWQKDMVLYSEKIKDPTNSPQPLLNPSHGKKGWWNNGVKWFYFIFAKFEKREGKWCTPAEYNELKAEVKSERRAHHKKTFRGPGRKMNRFSRTDWIDTYGEIVPC